MKMNKQIFIVAIMALLAFSACKKTEDDFDDHIRELPHFSQINEDTNNEKKTLNVVEEDGNEAGTEICAVSEMMISGANSEFFLLDPTTDVIYPGAMLLGNSIPTGEYTPITYERNPITISISLPTTNQTSPVTEVINPKLSSVRTAVNELMDGMQISATPAYMQLSKTQTYSQGGLSRSIGVSYGDPVKALGGSVTFEEGETSNKVVIKFVQKYYTIDLDYPQTPSDWFVDPVAVLKDKNIGENSPVYVSSVTYGRMALITIESTESYDNIIGTVNASLSVLPSGITNGGGSITEGIEPPEIEATFTQEQTDVFNTFKMDIMVLGGSGSNAANMIAVTDLNSYATALSDFINGGAEWSPESPGVMLSYKLRHLGDNSIADVVLADRYKIRDCNRSKFIFSFRMDNWAIHTDDTGYECEVKGKVKGTVLDPLGNVVAEHTYWDRGETDIDEDTQYTDFGDSDLFTYVHQATNENGDVSAEGYTLKLEIENMWEIDDWNEGGSDDRLNATPVIIPLDDYMILSSGLTPHLHVTGDGYIDMNFTISAL